MRDTDVRHALREYLDEENDPRKTLIVNEFGICNGRSLVDVAVVNGELVGYEIKSAADRLDRLPGQCEMYGKVLDRAVLVVAASHYEEAAEMVPEWWGVTLADGDRHDVSLEPIKPAEPNPAPDTFSLARLLWREEALEVLERYEIADGIRTKPRRYLWARLSDELEHACLAEAVRRAIKSRIGWPDSG